MVLLYHRFLRLLLAEHAALHDSVLQQRFPIGEVEICGRGVVLATLRGPVTENGASVGRSRVRA